MKKTLVFIAKLLIWLGFFTNLGIIEAFKKANISDGKEKVHTREEEGRFFSQMILLVDQKTKLAEAKIAEGKVYSIEDYFADYRQVRDSMDAFGQTVYTNIAHLLQFVPTSTTKEQINNATDKYFPEQAQRRKETATHTMSSSEIGAWWLGLYLKTLPLALLLFLLWLYEASDFKRFRLRNPLSFCLCLLLYPAIIAFNVIKFWINTKREIGAEIQIRRGKDKIFSVLADDEIAMIKDFARSNMSFTRFKAELHLKGYAPKHTFVVVGIAMLVMSIAPIRVCVGLDSPSKEQVSISQSLYQNVSHSFVVANAPPVYCDVFEKVDEWNLDLLIVYIKTAYAGYLYPGVCRGHFYGLDPVPLVVESNVRNKTFNN